MAAAIIELDTLADAVGSRTENHDLRTIGWVRFVLFFVRRVKIRRVGFEFSAAGIDALVDGNQAELLAVGAHFVFASFRQVGEAAIGERGLFECAQQVEGNVFQHGYALVPRANCISTSSRDESVPHRRLNFTLNLHHLLELIEKPRIDA